MTPQTFDEWFTEREAFGLRCERLMDMEAADALQAAWNAGRDSANRHALSPADSIPHRPCKSCGGTQIGEQDGNRIVLRCIQCRQRESEC